MEVLISRLSSLGDTVCCLPVASAMKATFPDCRISWIVEPRFSTIVERCSSVDDVIPFKFKFGQRVNFDRRFDVAMDLQGLLKSSWPILCCRSDVKVGYHWQREGSRLFSRRVLPDPSSLHVVDQYVDVARSVGAEADRAEFNLIPSPEAVLAVRKKLKSAGISGRFVVMNPTAAWVTKRWPTERYSALIDDLAAKGLASVLIGGNTEVDRRVCESVLNGCQSGPGNLSGQTNLEELIALIRLSSAHVGGDTGSSHIAAALDIPAIGIYSITRPERSCPYGQIERCLYHPGGLDKIDVSLVSQTVLAATGEPSMVGTVHSE